MVHINAQEAMLLVHLKIITNSKEYLVTHKNANSKHLNTIVLLISCIFLPSIYPFNDFYSNNPYDIYVDESLS